MTARSLVLVVVFAMLLPTGAVAAPVSNGIGFATDIGGVNDGSFNELTKAGLDRAAKTLGTTSAVRESMSFNDYRTNLDTLALNNSLVFGVGFLMGDSVAEAAAASPASKFAIIDFTYTGRTGAWNGAANATGVLFNERQAGYLAGTLAGAVEKRGGPRTNRAKVVSVVGGQRIPPVVRYINGFRDGVRRTCGASCKVLVNYSQDFVDQTKCQDIAKRQIRAGSDIIFAVAGQCGAGALGAAKAAKVWGVGVDADQSYLGPHMLTSAVKRVDVATFELIKRHLAGTLVTGKTTSFSIAQNAVGIGRVAPAARKYQPLVNAAIRDLKSGRVR